MLSSATYPILPHTSTTLCHILGLNSSSYSTIPSLSSILFENDMSLWLMLLHSNLKGLLGSWFQVRSSGLRVLLTPSFAKWSINLLDFLWTWDGFIIGMLRTRVAILSNLASRCQFLDILLGEEPCCSFFDDLRIPFCHNFGKSFANSYGQSNFKSMQLYGIIWAFSKISCIYP